MIYLALAAFVVYQALPSQRGDPRLAHSRPLFVLSCVLNGAWLVSWHALLIPLSELLMAALLVSLIVLYSRVGLWRGRATTVDRWLIDVPFSLYLGWISVATIANTAAFLLDRGFNGGGAAVALTVTMQLVATVLALIAIARRSDAAFALAVAWGLAGVAVAQAGHATAVSYAGWLGAAGLLAMAARTLFRHQVPSTT